MIAGNRATFGTARSRRIVWCLAAFATLYAVASTPGAKAAGVAASYCLTIAVSLEETPALVDRFDGFARRAGLLFERGNPGGRFYFGSNDSEMVGLTNGMGEFGSILSYVSQEAKAQSDLLDRLQRFVENEIATRYKTTLCEDIEGFRPPVVYNWRPSRT